MSSRKLVPALQAFETAVLLLGLSRFPGCLVTVVSAIETLLEPQFPELRDVREDKLKLMLQKASNAYRWRYSKTDLFKLRKTRNRFVHAGFIPDDNPESIKILFKTAIPMLADCFRDIHNKFDRIKSLVPMLSKHMELAELAYRRLQEASADWTHCVDALVHLLQLTLADSFVSSATVRAMHSHGFESRVFEATKEEKDNFIHRDGISWDKPHFDCPICQEGQSILCELDGSCLDEGKIRPIRLLCTHCDFSVGNFSQDARLEGYEPILCGILLRAQIENLKREDIIGWLEGFGDEFSKAIEALRATRSGAS